MDNGHVGEDEDMEDQGWKINGMSVEELQALEDLDEAEEELRRWRAKKNKEKNMKKQTAAKSKKMVKMVPIPMYNCEICGHVYIKLSILQTHWKQAHNPNAKFKCPECPKALSSRQSVKKHMLSHRPESDWPVSYELCDRRFTGVQELQKHFTTPKHKEDEKVQAGSDSLKDILSRCETKPLPEIDNETIQRVKTISKKKFKSLFDKKAPVKVLSQAKALEMRNKNISLVCCKICNRVFVGKDKYEEHLDECSKNIVEKQNDDDQVKVEKQVGYEELPFMGHYEKVKPAKKPPSMKKYRDLDGDYVPSGLSDAKPGQLRKCTFCSNQYDKTSNMKNHTLNHFMAKIKSFLPKNKPFKCPTCGLVQRDIITLCRHYAFTHKNVYDYCSEEELRGIPVGKSSMDDDGDYMPPNGEARSERNQLVGHQIGSQDKSDSEEDEDGARKQTNNTSKAKDYKSAED